MIKGRLAVLSLVAAPVVLHASAVLSGCGGTVIQVTDGGTGSGSGGSSGGTSSSSGISSSSSGGSSSSSSGISSSSSSGSSSSSSGISSSSSSGGPDSCANLPPGACQPPPPPPSGAQPTPLTAAHDYAMHQLFLGDTDRQGVPGADTWKSFGYDLDGKLTNASSTDVCALVPGSSKQVQVDGNGGTDNSWGANIMPIITTLDSTASQSANQTLQAGAWTQLTYVVGFDDSAGNMTSAFGLTGVELTGAQYPGTPSWDLTTNWPVAPVYISGCSPTTGCPAGTDPVASAQFTFPKAYQTNGTFVTGSPGPMSIEVDVSGRPLILPIQSAVITFDPQAPGAVTNGVIAGVLSTPDLIAGLQAVAGSISTSLCMGSAFQSIATQIEQTSDIVLTGSTVSNSAGQGCNAISIGLGFNATEIAPPGTIAAPSAPPPNPCGDGG